MQATFGQGAAFWPVIVGVIGVALLWRQADEAQRERWFDRRAGSNPVQLVFGSGGWAAYARVARGGGARRRGGLHPRPGRRVTRARPATRCSPALLGVVGLAFVVGPWVFRLASDLSAERAERIRTQERADVAAHLHDSVLQTLALIQKNADDAATVARLARAQERDLRSWLYAGEATDDRSVASALRGAAAEVEDAHGITVDVVAVGDCAMHETLRPILAAAREAMTNAAKHAGTGRVDVYAEIADSAVVGVRPRPRRRLRSGCGAGGPDGCARQHRRPDGPARRHRRGPHPARRRHRGAAVTCPGPEQTPGEPMTSP